MTYNNVKTLKSLPSRTQEQIKQSFLSYEKTYKQLSTEYDVSESTMIAFLKWMGIDIKAHNAKPKQEAIRLAVESFISGTPMKEVESKFHVDNTSVYNYMKRHNITYKSGHGRKNFFNQHFFHDIDTESKAYFLGFLYADGWIGGVDKNYARPCNINLDLSSKDRQILEKYLECIEASGSTHIKDYIASERTYKASPMSLVSLTSVTMADDLVSHGFKGLKPNRISVPELPTDMYRHFVRGYFDGDGCTYSSTVSFTGYISFLQSLEQIIKMHLEISSPGIRHDYKNKEVGDLQYYEIASRIRLFNWFYDSASIYLQRKKEHFVDTIK